MSGFTHLHLHTQYSVLDGANKIKPLLARAREMGQTSIGMTDHGNMHGVIEFYSAAKEVGLKPIVGCEVYLTSGSRFERKRSSQGGASTHHLTLLAMNSEGYRNLCRLVSLAYIEGFYFRPRIDHEILAQFNKGIICLSGCLSGEFGVAAKNSRDDQALEIAKKYHQVFGDRFYLEVQPHRIEEQQRLNEIARHVSAKLGLPMVATNDCHYLDAGDHFAQEVLMCIGTGKLLSDTDRLKHDSEGVSLHLKSESEMLAELPGFAEACAITQDIAARCDLQFDFKTYHMPRFEPPQGEDVNEFFMRESRESLERFFALSEKRGDAFNEKRKESYRERLEEELGIICDMGFPGYFLVVSDFIRWAKNNDIPVGPGRGSAAGSLVAYVLNITEIDPIRYNLLFERFLNPERISMPDIDVDFCINGRDNVIKYVSERYGRESVAQIATFGTLKAKAAIKDVGRVLGMSYAETDRIAKLIPAPRQGFDYPIAEALKMEKKLQEYADGEGKQLIDLAQKLEGLSRHVSTHAAGLVIADRPLVDYLPLILDKDEQVVTQFSMKWVEKIGLVKFDFLGLKTLTVLHGAVQMIKETEGVEIDLNNLPLADKKVYRMLSTGQTTGVFQLESSGMTEMLCRLKPTNFEDIVAMLALYRPGPLDSGMADHYINRKNGREKVVYLHPLLEPVLKDTFGIILYQEQIMRIARDMAGYSLGEADMLRRAMGKKDPEAMAKQRSLFMDGAGKKGIAEKIATETFDQMETFARYGFNRSHSVAYAMISFQTAYLKAHYPTCFMAALMTHEMSDTDKTLKNINECREQKISLLAPDVNTGKVGFSVRGKKVVFGLAAIKGVGEKAVEHIISERSAGGPYRSLLDFCRRLPGEALNKRILEGFIFSGAFDWTKLPRAELLARLEDVLKLSAREKKEQNSNQIGLFDSFEDVVEEQYTPQRPLMREWPKNELLANEKAALGFYLSGHPLEQYRNDLTRLGASSTSALRNMRDGQLVTVAGVVTFLKLKNTKKGDRYATFLLEDMLGTVETVVWPDVYQNSATLLGSEEPVIVGGKLDVGDERLVLIVNSVESLLERRGQSAKEATVRLRHGNTTGEQVRELKKIILAQKPGQVDRQDKADKPGKASGCVVKLLVSRENHSDTVIALPSSIRVEAGEEFCQQVESLLGAESVTFR
ncbi:MAG: DNA polymerase III subunit alpha [bacterium]|nr:DNA polymerase III subunit alpha [bacterium]